MNNLIVVLFSIRKNIDIYRTVSDTENMRNDFLKFIKQQNHSQVKQQMHLFLERFSIFDFSVASVLASDFRSHRRSIHRLTSVLSAKGLNDCSSCMLRMQNIYHISFIILATCDFECKNDGTCTGYNECTCITGFSGPTCEVRTY